VELLLNIEQSFQTQIDIGDFEVENFRCIEKISNLILQQNGGNRAAQASPTGAV
jgi:acyl carrier protein